MDFRDYVAFLPLQRRVRAECMPTGQRWVWNSHVIHVARRRNAQAPIRLIVCHGAGGYSDALWPICAQIDPAACDLFLPDLPLYGYSTTVSPQNVRYEDWIECLRAFIEETDDGRPVILWGFSIGGMLAHEVACRSPLVNEVIATCLVDPRSLRARLHIGRWGMGLLGTPFLGVGRRSPLSKIMIPMKLVANMGRMSRKKALSVLCAKDPRGGGAAIPLGFLATFLAYPHSRRRSEGEAAVRITLAHPAQDAWTPASLSITTLRRLEGVGHIVMLENCGHFPIEEPGLTQLVEAVEERLHAVAGGVKPS